MVWAYGPNVNALKGKTARRPHYHIGNDQLILLPPEIRIAHPEVTLSVDIFYIHKLTLLLRILRDFGICQLSGLNDVWH